MQVLRTLRYPTIQIVRVFIEICDRSYCETKLRDRSREEIQRFFLR